MLAVGVCVFFLLLLAVNYLVCIECDKFLYEVNPAPQGKILPKSGHEFVNWCRSFSTGNAFSFYTAGRS